ncbi:MAG: peptidase S41 [Bdellovibrionales bacterium RBG_16_40_8]|nr:MAG: peptidase S41 [Bdellovibrionales bacterium RBG_16_40_8]
MRIKLLNKKKLRWQISIILVLALLGVVYFTSGLRAYAKDRYTDLQLFTKVLNLVQQYYVEEVDTKKLIYGGIKGMLRELDPHTNFLPPEIYKEFESETSGEFGGLGIEITVRKGVLTVISPIEDTPAYKAGVKSGDRILTINGESTKGLDLIEAAQKMRGSRGSKVILGIFREGFERPKDIAVVRGTVKIHSIKFTDLEDGYVYVRLTSFIENTARDFKKAIAEHTKKYKNVRGLILDLRKNPGGLLDQAVEMSNLFLESGIIVSTMDRNKKDKQTMFAKKEGTLASFPMVVLVDEYSASASEILAGALQDNKRALIMGQRTFGKGSVQSVVKLVDGSGLKLTVARYYTPAGRSIQAEGIVPDVSVDNLSSEVIEMAMQKNQVRREKDISGHLEADEEDFNNEYDIKISNEKGKKTKPGPGTITPSGAGFMETWLSGSEKKGEADSPKNKLLKEDFQALQAYNYLRAWRVMKGFDEQKTEIHKADSSDENSSVKAK